MNPPALALTNTGSTGTRLLAAYVTVRVLASVGFASLHATLAPIALVYAINPEERPFALVEARASIEDRWLRDGAMHPILDLDRERLTLRHDGWPITAGRHPTDLDPARMRSLAEQHPRVLLAPRDGVDLQRIVSAMDALRLAGFTEVIVDVEPR